MLFQGPYLLPLAVRQVHDNVKVWIQSFDELWLKGLKRHLLGAIDREFKVGIVVGTI